MQIAESIPKDLTSRFRVMSQSRAGEDVEKVVHVTMRTGKTGVERLQGAGLSVRRRNTDSPPVTRSSLYWFPYTGRAAIGLRFRPYCWLPVLSRCSATASVTSVRS